MSTTRQMIDGARDAAGGALSPPSPLARVSPIPLPRWRTPVPLPRRPTVSVVIPCYNYGHFLRDCVDSVLTQDGVDVDVLIVDDASPDGSGEVAEAIAAGDPRVRVLRHEQNRGHIATYNDGLARVDGEFVLLLSADDKLVPGALGRAAALMVAEPTVGLVYGAVVCYRDTDRGASGRFPPARTRQTSWSVWAGPAWIETMCRTGANHVLSPEAVMRTSVLRQVGLYRRDLPHSGDMEMWMRAAAVADVGRVNGADQAYYRVHDDSMMRTSFNTVLADMGGKRDAFAVAFDDGPASELANASELRELAGRRLALLALAHAREARDGGDAEAVASYLAFAREVWPAVPADRRYRALGGSPDAPTGREARQVATGAVRVLRTKARWKVRRLVGI